MNGKARRISSPLARPASRARSAERSRPARIVLLFLALSGWAGCAAPWTIDRLHGDLEAFRRQVEPPEGYPGLVPLRTSVHVHSEFSHDSDGKISEIAKAARACDVQVVFLTDHTNPDIFEHGPDGWVDGVYFVPGEEVSVGGSMLALGTRASVPKRGQNGQAVIEQILENDGVAAIGHLEQTDTRNLRGYSAVSIHNLHADANRIPLLAYPKVLLDALLYGHRRADEVILRELVCRRGPELARWDRLLAHGRVAAIAEVDAHQNIEVLGLRLDPYERILRTLHTYLLVPEIWSREDLMDALRRGRAYVAFSVIADPTGFAFEGLGADGEVFLVGDEVPCRAGLKLRVRSPAPAEIVLIKDGQEIARKRDRELVVGCDSPGVYRVDVRVKLGGRTYPWIHSNPIYVGITHSALAYEPSGTVRQTGGATDSIVRLETDSAPVDGPPRDIGP